MDRWMGWDGSVGQVGGWMEANKQGKQNRGNEKKKCNKMNI